MLEKFYESEKLRGKIGTWLTIGSVAVALSVVSLTPQLTAIMLGGIVLVNFVYLAIDLSIIHRKRKLGQKFDNLPAEDGYADLVKAVALKCGEERGSKCGYDLLKGLAQGDVELRAQAWRDFLQDYPNGVGASAETERDGVWVPVIPESLS